MKFIIFNGSLKQEGESNTYTVCQMLDTAFKNLKVESEIVTLNEIDFEATTDNVNDALTPYIKKIFDADGVIFATPIWWGVHSCWIQGLIERLDYIHTWSDDNNFQPFYNKVFGSCVSGGGDGFQHIHGIFFNFACNLGFTVPPQCNVESKAQGRDNILSDDPTIEQIKICAQNMYVYGSLIKSGNPAQYARHGSIDISGKDK